MPGNIKGRIPLADLRDGAPGTRTPWGSKFFHFHAVFGKLKEKNNSTFGSFSFHGDDFQEHTFVCK